jgi:histidyl-tRNA synthetase
LHQLQYCEDNKIPFAVIIGEDEIKNNVVKLKDVNSRAEETVTRDKLVELLKEKLRN